MLEADLSDDDDFLSKIDNDSVLKLKAISINVDTEKETVIKKNIVSSYKYPVTSDVSFICNDTVCFMNYINSVRNSTSKLNLIKYNTKNKNITHFTFRKLSSFEKFNNGESVYFIRKNYWPRRPVDSNQIDSVQILDIKTNRIYVAQYKTYGNFNFINCSDNTCFFWDYYQTDYRILGIRIDESAHVSIQEILQQTKHINEKNMILYIKMSDDQKEYYKLHTDSSYTYLIKELDRK